jgi:hypothetical protein
MATSVYAGKTADEILKMWTSRIKNRDSFLQLAEEVSCIKNSTLRKYFEIKSESNLSDVQKRTIDAIRQDIENGKPITKSQTSNAVNTVWANSQIDVLSILRQCSDKILIDPITGLGLNSLEPGMADTFDPMTGSAPFDKRLKRLEQNVVQGRAVTLVPFDSAFAEVATSGYLISREYLQDLPENTPDKASYIKSRENQYKQLINDEFHWGVPALQNAYALTLLYGSRRGSKLVNQKNERRWYEVDVSPDQEFNFASTPTTSTLIDWGSGDPYGRTPYFFTDFVFSKYWNKIANNRLITLRRYPAPIIDNLKFPGMTGNIDSGSSDSNTTGGDVGSDNAIKAFTPMASAVTYFGGETGNTLNSLLKFTTGVEWGEVQGEIWNVTTNTGAPDTKSGLGTVFKGLGRIAEMLNVGAGNFSTEFVGAGGVLPPDPYSQGPFENRIQGPINRIDKVMKRNPGLKYENNLSLVFEYVSRPVGGINPKAVLLDILGNFLVIGSASAVFFGGAHRFMIDPAKTPFIGKQQKLYSGNLPEYVTDAMKSFTGEQGLLREFQTQITASLKGFWDLALSLFEKGTPFADKLKAGGNNILNSGAIKNFANNYVATKTSGQIAYLQGLKSILTGQPVGEWHLTIGNPLNPIAMIGNLICDNIVVEFNEELGPDDFPTEIKITVNLKHAMARDRDAIESIFNRGMGRIYNLPDGFLGSADYQSVVDITTKPNTAVGTMPGGTMGIIYTPGQDKRFVSPKDIKGSPNQLHGQVSIWDRTHFHVGFSENSEITPRLNNEILRTAYRTADWLAQKALL